MKSYHELIGLCKILLCSLGIALGATSAYAFEGYEHRQISDLALTIATEYNCPQGTLKKTKCSQVADNTNKLLNESGTNDFSYGRINELVDYMHYPEQIFEHYSADIDPPTESKHLSSHVLRLMENNTGNLALFDYLSASSHNERHFQEAMMESMHYLHKDAITDARQGNLYRALVRSALSNHYLNDFFAPGHVTTPRENSHDAVALAMHDRANKSGACFVIASSQWRELEPILAFIEKGNPDGVPYNFLIKDERETRDSIYANLVECGSKVEGKRESYNIGGGDLTKNAVFQQRIIRFLAANHNELFLQGDGRLKDNPAQQLFMLLVQVKAISEVMQAYLQCDNSNGIGCSDNGAYTTDYNWTGIYGDTDDITPPQAKIRYGEYRINDEKSNGTWIPFFSRPKYAYPAVADDAFLLSLGGQAPVSQQSSRYEIQLELFPMTSGTSNQWEWLRNKSIHRPSTDCQWFGMCNLGVSYGLSYLHDESFAAKNFQLRLIKALPKISGQLSANIRRGYYDGKGINRWKTSYGMRYDHGFSLHTFYVGYQGDFVADNNNEFKRENVVTFGWTLSFPASRFLGYFGGY